MAGEPTTSKLPRWVQTVMVGRKPAWTLVRLVVLVAGAWLIFTFVLTPPIRVTGISMQPTYHDGQINFLNRLAYMRHDPRRGDVVGLRFDPRSSGEHLMLFKRIVGLPGEEVSFHNGKLCINGEPRDEPYVKFKCHWEMDPKKLGFNEYYVVGDNRSMPIENHQQGVAARSQIVGRVLWRGES